MIEGDVEERRVDKREKMEERVVGQMMKVTKEREVDKKEKESVGMRSDGKR